MKDSEDRKEEATNKINLKVDPVTVKPKDRNQDVTDKTDQEAIKKTFMIYPVINPKVQY